MDLAKVAVIGAGRRGKSVLEYLLKLTSVNVTGIADIEPNAPGIETARKKGIPVYFDYHDMFAEIECDVVVDATGINGVQVDVRTCKPAHASLMDAWSAELFIRVIAESHKCFEVKETNELLHTILDSAQEGVQVTDLDGEIIYINKAFSEITRIKPEERIGKNIFDVSPDGALCEVLQTKKPIFGKPNVVEGSEVEVISNASPIMVNGKMTGAVVVFRDVTDMKRILKKLNEREEIIDTLKGEIQNLTSARYTFKQLYGSNRMFCEVISIAKRVAKSASTVLITGESGTGKELFAHAIHSDSARREMPFVAVNCAAIPANLLESELFGHEKGAFTGAAKRKMGKFELANGGTVFLDEIGDMELMLQVKILRVLQEREIERIGGSQPIKIDVRIIAATNRNLTKLVDKGEFRQDLYYRLNVIGITIPPLRERMDDLPELTARILDNLNHKLGKKVGLCDGALKLIQAYSWPGNVRELENVLERAVTLCDGKIIGENLLRPYLESDVPENDGILPLDMMEKRMIIKAVEKYGLSVSSKKEIARALNISLGTLYNKLRKYKIPYKI